LQTASETIVSAIRDAVSTARAAGYDPDKALDTALANLETVVEREWAKAVFDLLVRSAEELDADEHDEDSVFYDGVAAFLSLAMEIDARIPMDDRA
jgi:hypothetical protein